MNLTLRKLAECKNIPTLLDVVQMQVGISKCRSLIIVGVISGPLLSPKKTKTGEWMLRILIYDDSLRHKDCNATMPVFMFRRSLDEFPKFEEGYFLVVIGEIEMNVFKGDRQITIPRAIFDREGVDVIAFSSNSSPPANLPNSIIAHAGRINPRVTFITSRVDASDQKLNERSNLHFPSENDGRDGDCVDLLHGKRRRAYDDVDCKKYKQSTIPDISRVTSVSKMVLNDAIDITIMQFVGICRESDDYTTLIMTDYSPCGYAIHSSSLRRIKRLLCFIDMISP
jgi:hypothetical protein